MSTTTSAPVSYAKIAKKASNESDPGIEDNEVAVVDAKQPEEHAPAPTSTRSSSGKKRHKRERREKKSPQPKSDEAAASAADKDGAAGPAQPVAEEPVKYVDAPPPKTNPWIKGPPGPLPPAPLQSEKVLNSSCSVNYSNFGGSF